MSFKKCERCGRGSWGSTSGCSCKLYYVRFDWYEVEDEQKVYELGPSEAAEKFVDDWECNNAEYDTLSGAEQKVIVRDTKENEKKFIVSGEAVPTYYASEVEDFD